MTQTGHNTTGSTVDIVYHFGYDSLGRQTTVSVGSHTLSTTAYNADGTTASVTYGNGGEVRYSYDEFQRLEGVPMTTKRKGGLRTITGTAARSACW